MRGVTQKKKPDSNHNTPESGNPEKKHSTRKRQYVDKRALPSFSPKVVYHEVQSTQKNASGQWITDTAWITGVIGAISVLLCAFWFHKIGALSNGISIAGHQLIPDRLDSLLFVLCLNTAIMLFAESIRLWLWDRKRFFCIDPNLQGKRYLLFVGKSVVNYLLSLGLLWLVIGFYHTVNEYGFLRQGGEGYYKPWFRLLEYIQTACLWGGLPYVLLTLAVKHSPEADRRDMIALLRKIGLFLGAKLAFVPREKAQFEDIDQKNGRALMVKLFFAPLMTVFFADQFPHLVRNIDYIFSGLIENIRSGNYTHQQFNTDFYNISMSIIFSVDVALAWCGYVVSSRWVDNQTSSAEPTMLGWVVCVSCYPPFQGTPGLLYSSPGEHDILLMQNQSLITFFIALMVLSYLIYVSATMAYGVRFSNLTNRGILRKGPYALVRHPAYAAKNFSWWCVMFPAAIYMGKGGSPKEIQHSLLLIFGLIFITWFYFWRAITEERHLSADPAYLEYCKNVRYRFIPGIV